jgi:enoyl-CoA hydratase/carnithine racemase
MARQAAGEIASLPPEAVALSRKLLRPAPEETLRVIDEEAGQFAARMRSPEAIAAFTAFLSRRK